MGETRILIRFLGCIFHGTGNSARLCQNFRIISGGGVWTPQTPLWVRQWIHHISGEAFYCVHWSAVLRFIWCNLYCWRREQTASLSVRSSDHSMWFPTRTRADNNCCRQDVRLHWEAQIPLLSAGNKLCRSIWRLAWTRILAQVKFLLNSSRYVVTFQYYCIYCVAHDNTPMHYRNNATCFGSSYSS
jgi:hypothetical protein